MSFSDTNRSTDVILSSGYYVAGKSGGSGSWRGVLGNNGLSGKIYFEISVTTYNGLLWLGIGTLTAAVNASPATGGSGTAYVYASDAYKSNGAGAVSFGATYAASDVIGVAFDATAGAIWFAKNNTWQASGNPATGANPAYTGITGAFFPIAAMSGTAGAVTVTIKDNGSQTYSPPSGFTALNGPAYSPPNVEFSGAAVTAATTSIGELILFPHLSGVVSVGEVASVGAVMAHLQLRADTETDLVLSSGRLQVGGALRGEVTTEGARSTGAVMAHLQLRADAKAASVSSSGGLQVGGLLRGAVTTDGTWSVGQIAVRARLVSSAALLPAVSSGECSVRLRLSGAVVLPPVVSLVNQGSTYVYYPDHDAFTEYANFGFNSYARIGGKYFAASNSGLYRLEGNDDAGAQISAYVLTGMLDFGGHTMSRTPRVYFDFSGDSGLAVSVYTSTDGLRRTEAFTLSLPTTPVDRSACLPLGRGLPSHFWQYRVSNVAGGALEFTRCAPHVIPLTRSI